MSRAGALVLVGLASCSGSSPLAAVGAIGAPAACSGTLIAAGVVLSAAHCFDEAAPRTFHLASGASFEIAGAALHPAYDRAAVRAPEPGLAAASDVALAFLAEPSAVSPAAMSEEHIGVGARVEVAGWGGGELREVETALVEVGAAELRVGPASACHGDSGGPALLDGEVIAVISRTADPFGSCAAGAIATRVDVLRGWIDASLTARR